MRELKPIQPTANGYYYRVDCAAVLVEPPLSRYEQLQRRGLPTRPPHDKKHLLHHLPSTIITTTPGTLTLIKPHTNSS